MLDPPTSRKYERNEEDVEVERGTEDGGIDVLAHDNLLNVVPPLLRLFPDDEESVLRMEEGNEVRGTGDGDRVVEEGKSELAEGVRDEEEVGRDGSERGGWGSEGGAKEDESEDLFEDLYWEVCVRGRR